MFYICRCGGSLSDGAVWGQLRTQRWDDTNDVSRVRQDACIPLCPERLRIHRMFFWRPRNFGCGLLRSPSVYSRGTERRPGESSRCLLPWWPQAIPGCFLPLHPR